MRSNTVCSEMVLTGFANDLLYLTLLALLLKRYIQRLDRVLRN